MHMYRKNSVASPKCGHVPSEQGFIYNECFSKNYLIPGNVIMKKNRNPYLCFEMRHE